LVGLQAARYSYDEITTITGDSSRTVDRQLVRARKRLAIA
jgi:DNA-directed RNA polymerase specialized sigma24 family protein